MFRIICRRGMKFVTSSALLFHLPIEQKKYCKETQPVTIVILYNGKKNGERDVIIVRGPLLSATPRVAKRSIR